MGRIGSQLYGPANVFEGLYSLLVEIVHNRLKILLLELREEKIHFIQLFIMATFVVFLAVLTVVLTAFTVIYAIPTEFRLLGLLVATGVFLITTVALTLTLVRKLSRHPIPFTHAMSERAGREG